MRGINYLAGFGTVLLFASWYCFKPLLPPVHVFREDGESVNKRPLSKKDKFLLLLAGCACIVGGVILLLLSIPKATS
jgi:hypothetical protein